MDAVQQANSGHPGMPMGMADIAEVLWNSFLKHNPKNPQWPNRDRFILSNGHGSMLQYALLHLAGYDLRLEDLKKFRQLHSKTPGHPEVGITPGVETTTGPLGQGLAMAVGIALAEQLLASTFNRASNKPNSKPGTNNFYNIVDHNTYCFVGDGCLMEGVSHEVCSLAGTWGLNKLIVFWDDNGISIDGKVEGWFDENISQRFQAYNWHVIADVDGHDATAVQRAIVSARQQKTKPTLICCKTTIGFGSPKMAGTADCHGSPLGADEVSAARQQLAWPEQQPFIIPQDIYTAWDARESGKHQEDMWREQFAAYAAEYPELAQEFTRRMAGELPTEWQAKIDALVADIQQVNASIPTRKASQQMLEHLAELLPELLGGSADLSGSNLTLHKKSKVFLPDKNNYLVKYGNYIHYGVREFGMSAIMNGIALYRGIIPYGGTFLTFIDYARNAIRMSALMQQRVIYVLTHDSIGLGEDGPTHQPVEHLSMLRLTPNLSVWRPCDTVETAVAWQMAIERRDGPTVLALTRQKVIGQIRNVEQVAAIKRGGYILAEMPKLVTIKPNIIFIATGSEVDLAMQAGKFLQQDGYAARVVSMPSMDVFSNQDLLYQAEVLPAYIPKIAIEAGATGLWYKFVGSNGAVVGIDRYGESAPEMDVYQEVGITAAKIVAKAKQLLGQVN